jgi:flagellar hook protein FlgE
MTDMLVEKRAFQFNVAALKTQDEMLGTIIDLKG